MSLLIFDRFGGRHYRYKTIPGTLVQILDPWERRTLSLSSPWLRDLWLCCKADTAVEAIAERPKPLEFLAKGRRLQGVADFAVKQSGSITYHALVRDDSAEGFERQLHLGQAACAHGVHYRAWKRDELTQRRVLIENMGHIRQCLAVWLDWNLISVEQRIMATLAAGALTRKQARLSISAELGEEGIQQFDAGLFRLYYAKRVLLDLNRRYDDEILIARL